MEFNIIITMAGKGTRLKKTENDVNKQDIIVNGHTLFFWSMLSLTPFFGNNFIFIANRNRVNLPLIKKQCKQLQILNYKILLLDADTSGQASTVLAAEHLINPSLPIVIYNIDTYMPDNPITPFHIKRSYAGFIPFFVTTEKNKYSYARIGHQRVLEIKEKIPISPFATTGFYYFNSFYTFRCLYYELYNDEKKNTETYIAPLYNLLISRNQFVGYKIIDKVHVLGTPEEIEVFRTHVSKEK